MAFQHCWTSVQAW